MGCCNHSVPEFIFTLNEGLDESFLPARANDQDTGWDVKAAETVTFKPTQKILIPLGIRTLAPAGYWLELRPRSSSFGKKNLHALYGVVDEGYEGQIYFACQWIPSAHDGRYDDMELCGALEAYLSRELVIEKGERIGQLVPVKRQAMGVSCVSAEEFQKLCEERGQKRGAGGFGSTGK